MELIHIILYSKTCEYIPNTMRIAFRMVEGKAAI
jgi:hypothetical protein